MWKSSGSAVQVGPGVAAGAITDFSGELEVDAVGLGEDGVGELLGLRSVHRHAPYQRLDPPQALLDGPLDDVLDEDAGLVFDSGAKRLAGEQIGDGAEAHARRRDPPADLGRENRIQMDCQLDLDRTRCRGRRGARSGEKPAEPAG
jgi:hypothetical protein